jgi:hypothetical protein
LRQKNFITTVKKRKSNKITLKKLKEILSLLQMKSQRVMTPQMIRKKVVITLNQSNHLKSLMVELLREIKLLKVLINQKNQKFAQ